MSNGSSESDEEWRKENILAIEKYFCNNFDDIYQSIFVQEFFEINEKDLYSSLTNSQFTRKQFQKKLK